MFGKIHVFSGGFWLISISEKLNWSHSCPCSHLLPFHVKRGGIMLMDHQLLACIISPQKLSIMISCRGFCFQTGWIYWLENWFCFGNEWIFYKIDKCKSWSQMSTNTVLIGYLEEIRSIWLIPKKVTLFQDNFKSYTAPSSSSCPETRAFADLGCLWMGMGTFLNCFSFWGWFA